MARTAQRRWFPIVLRELEVLRVHDVTPRMRRVVLGGAELGEFERYGYHLPAFGTEAADDHVKAFFPAPGEDHPVLPGQGDGHLDWPHEGPRPLGRDYTPRRFDPETGELDLDFVVHPGGVASEWAQQAQPGQRLFIAGPKLSTIPPSDVGWYLIVGDETALPAIGRWLEELPSGARAKVFVEVVGPEDEQELDTDVDITWLHRGATPAGESDLLERAVREMTWPDAPDWPADDVYAWVAGESATIRGIRRYLRHERGLSAEQVAVTGYWKRGAAQMEAPSKLPELREMASLVTPHALRAVITLGVPELMASGVRTVAELAERTGANARALHGVLSYLAAKDVFRASGPGRFEPTELGELLAEDDVRSRLHLDMATAPRHLAFGGLLHTLRTGEAGYPQVFDGGEYWSDLSRKPEAAARFDAELARWAERWLPDLLRARDWSRDHVVDIGGGLGVFPIGVLREHQHNSATLVELPQVAQRARQHAADCGVGDRLTVVEQSFFDALPRHGDAYVLAQVLHDWNDADCVRILAQAAAAASPDGRVHVLERHYDPASPDADDHAFHLEMLVTFGSGERTEADYHALAREAGLEPVGTTAVGDHLRLFEYAPVAR